MSGRIYLLTGAAGNLGSNVSRELIAAGETVRGPGAERRSRDCARAPRRPRSARGMCWTFHLWQSSLPCHKTRTFM